MTGKPKKQSESLTRNTTRKERAELEEKAQQVHKDLRATRAEAVKRTNVSRAQQKAARERERRKREGEK